MNTTKDSPSIKLDTEEMESVEHCNNHHNLVIALTVSNIILMICISVLYLYLRNTNKKTNYAGKRISPQAKILLVSMHPPPTNT